MEVESDYTILLTDPVPRILPRVHSKFKLAHVTSDGIPKGKALEFAKTLSKDWYIIPNSPHTRIMLEYANVKLDENPHPHDPHIPRLGHPTSHAWDVEYTLGTNAQYTPPPGNWILDRKGYPIYIALLYKLWKKGYRYTAWINSNSLFVQNIGMAYGLVRTIRRIERVDIGVVEVIIAEHDYKPVQFLTNEKPDEQHPVYYTIGVNNLYEYYTSIKVYIAPSLVEGFGLGPYEANSVGKLAVVNPIENWIRWSTPCFIHLEPHSLKWVDWGLFEMPYVIPGVEDFEEKLIRVIQGEVKYNPQDCIKSVEWMTYDWIFKYVA